MMSTATNWFARVLLGSVVGLAVFSGNARADVAPPPGEKYAEYSFVVENVGEFADWALVAYPCNVSDGRPYEAGTVIAADTAVSVGRRGGTCAVYAMKRSAWVAWRDANPAPVELADDPALDALVSSGAMLACQGGPQPRFVVPVSAPDTIRDTVRVQVLTDTSCVLTVDAQQEPPTGCSVQSLAKGRASSTWAMVCAAVGLVALRRLIRRS